MAELLEAIADKVALTVVQAVKAELLNSQRIAWAEGEGFEPPEACASAVFKTAAIDRSAIPPG